MNEEEEKNGRDPLFFFCQCRENGLCVVLTFLGKYSTLFEKMPGLFVENIDGTKLDMD
jgi:hypothetical protein